MKRMLVIYPNNFLQGAMGTNNRIAQLVQLFKEIGFEIDFFSFENWSSDSNFKNFNTQNKDSIIHKLFLFDFKCNDDGNHHSGLVGRILQKVRNRLKKKEPKKYLHDWAPAKVQDYFSDILSKNNYDVIAMFYTYLATLFENRDIHAKKVYFMEDSMFLQQYSWSTNSLERHNLLGMLLNEELTRMRVFDEVFCISNDERIMYEKLTGKDMHFLPHLLPESFAPVATPIEKRRWDVYFIGFNNPFNVEGLAWFLREVYPNLDKNLRIVLVGSATNQIEVSYVNIDIIPFAPDLDEIYNNVKVAICPMFRGTGMKIKVVEAMAKGLPVVCNERGVDGLPDKTLCGCLVTQNAQEFARYINELCSNVDFYVKQSAAILDYYRKVFDRNKYKKMLENLI